MLGEIDRKCRLVKRWAAVAADSRPIYRDARPCSILKFWMLRALKAIRLVDFSREVRERNIYASFRYATIKANRSPRSWPSPPRSGAGLIESIYGS